MKKLFKLILILSVVLTINCAEYFIYKSTLPEFKGKSDKALIVYMRTLNMPEFNTYTHTTANGGTYTSVSIDNEGEECFVYLNGKYMGGTRNRCLTVFNVEPGEYLITSNADFTNNLKLDVKNGLIYYIEEIPIQMGPLGVKPFIQPISKEEAMEKIAKGQYRYSTPNPENLKDDLDADEYQEELEDWDEWIKDNPEEAKKFAEYKGYPID